MFVVDADCGCGGYNKQLLSPAVSDQNSPDKHP